MRTPREELAQTWTCPGEQRQREVESVFVADDTTDQREQGFGPARDEPPHSRECRERPNDPGGTTP